MEDYLESFTYNYSSIILGEYTLRFYVYEAPINQTQDGFSIKIENSLTDEKCFLEGYKTYDEAAEDVGRVNRLLKSSEQDITEQLF